MTLSFAPFLLWADYSLNMSVCCVLQRRLQSEIVNESQFGPPNRVLNKPKLFWTHWILRPKQQHLLSECKWINKSHDFKFPTSKCHRELIKKKLNATSAHTINLPRDAGMLLFVFSLFQSSACGSVKLSCIRWRSTLWPWLIRISGGRRCVAVTMLPKMWCHHQKQRVF